MPTGTPHHPFVDPVRYAWEHTVNKRYAFPRELGGWSPPSIPLGNPDRPKAMAMTIARSIPTKRL